MDLDVKLLKNIAAETTVKTMTSKKATLLG